MLKYAAETAEGNLLSTNNLAWFLANCSEPRLRNPSRAVELRAKSRQGATQRGKLLEYLGTAQFRAGDWHAAINALDKSIGLRAGGDVADWFFLAMAHWQKGETDKAHSWYDKAVAWMDAKQSKDDELNRFRAEATTLLQLDKRDAMMPNGARSIRPRADRRSGGRVIATTTAMNTGLAAEPDE